MNGMTYMILAYTVGLGLFWGYGVSIWLATRSFDRSAGVKPAATAGREARNSGGVQ